MLTAVTQKSPLARPELLIIGNAITQAHSSSWGSLAALDTGPVITSQMLKLVSRGASINGVPNTPRSNRPWRTPQQNYKSYMFHF